MGLPYSTHDEFVAYAAKVIQTAQPDITIQDGDVLLELIRASAHESIWLQLLTFLLLKKTRLSTSEGADVDSFLADYGQSRLPATYATGRVTFGRYSPIRAADIPLGTQVKTEDGEQTFIVVADDTATGWNASSQSYVIPAGVAGLQVPVKALLPGSQANVRASAITLITSPLSGVDTVINVLAFTNGVDLEPDDKARARFPDYINSRSLGTARAVGAAIQEVQQGISYTIQENTLPNGDTFRGFTTIFIDDGSGYPTTALLNTVSEAVEAVRPLGSEFAVRSANVVPAVISVTPVVRKGFNSAEVHTAISDTITAYVNGLGMGVTLHYLELVATARSAHDGIARFEEILVNNGESDLGGAPNITVRVSSLAVN